VGHHFEGHHEAGTSATPEQVWEAIATGPGIDSWFIGRTEVEPGPGGTVRTDFGGHIAPSAVTAWEPGTRLAYGSRPGPDGRFIAYEFLVAGRGRSGTVVRLVTSGFLPGDDWEAEYDAMRHGGAMFFATLVEYLDHFAGRTATPVTAFGPAVDDWPRAWSALRRALGLAGHGVAVGDRIRCHLPGLPPIDGAVYFHNAQTLGIRTTDALCRLLQGFHGSLIAAHHLFGADAGARAEQARRAWRSWLDDVLAADRYRPTPS
jgi:uncharacterized protein YndB with AHSA1/START domain